MQLAVIVIDFILSVLGFICICLKTNKINKNIQRNTKRIILPGAAAGLLISVVAIQPLTMANILSCVLLGILSGESIYILYLVAKSTWEHEKVITYYDDGTAPKYYITGDKHRNISYVKNFCQDMNTRKKDVLIILGDAGFNYFEDSRDDMLKKEAADLKISLFCLHGNKEKRPQNIQTYGIRSFCGGKVYYEPKYPNIYFAIDGEIYTFEGKKYIVVGGAHSVDKMRCIAEGKPFWEDEMPDESVKAKVEERLSRENNSIYGVMSHTCPIDYLPTEMFMSTRQNAEIKSKPKKIWARKKASKKADKKVFQPDIDRTTEEWLSTLEQRLTYEVWYCGHYHIDKQIDKVNMLYNEIRPLHL